MSWNIRDAVYAVELDGRIVATCKPYADYVGRVEGTILKLENDGRRPLFVRVVKRTSPERRLIVERVRGLGGP